MKRKVESFTGQRPVFTGSPSIVPGGFNLDREAQTFNVGQVIPAATPAIYNEQTRKVQLIKAAKVVEVDSDDNTKVSLKVDEFYAPIFCVGDKVAKAGAISGTYASAVSITSITENEGSFIVTLSGAISGLAADDVLVQVVSKTVTTPEVKANVISVSTTTVITVPGLDLAAGDKVMLAPVAASALIANATSVTSYDKDSGKLVLAASIADLAAGDVLSKVFASGTKAVTTQEVAIAAEIGEANGVTICDVEVDKFETAIDVTADTMQYAIYERRVPAIPASQKDASGTYLKGNPHIRFTQSF